MPLDYNKTLNLPKTAFEMRAGLVKKEPVMLSDWENNKLYDKMIEKNEGKPLFVLHDGPPYANGNIHLGTALNKTLKDIIVRYKNMSGFKSPYVPGWDTHGLPTELKARAKAGVENSSVISPVELRNICRDFALGYLDDQRNQFKRLGVLAEWDNPYVTLKPEFEAEQIRVFGTMAKKGYIYKGLKPVYWCPDCQTALAEAEIEYADDICYSIYVKFNVKNDKGILTAMGIDPKDAYIVIWTTTTWTLPANVAICVGPRFDYNVVKTGDKYLIMAQELTDGVMSVGKINDYEIVGTIKGADMEYMTAQHPFLDRESLVIVGDHVTLESGTGCVHTAPGHGVDDYNVCRNYPEIPIIVPVDNKGFMTEEAGPICAGMTTDDANKAIAKAIDESGHLFAMAKISHQYPHCWRCKKPVLFRATEQWFCSVDSFKDEAIEAIKTVKWYPAWGEDRISSMVRERSDWCISRQRKWGVPIPILYCEDCGEPIVTDETINKIADIFSKEGSTSWYANDTAYFVPEGLKCPKCGCDHFDREKDIMDVWFDSGTSHWAVCKNRDYLHWPADIYLEGADQYRGWFQSSLLTSVACGGGAPYKNVITHGWVVDGQGRKMSKSLGNGIDPQDVVKKYGADILRLWVASSDYHADIRISDEILKQLSETYRKIRNTARFILGNLEGFNPDEAVPYDELESVDKWALMRLNELVKLAHEAYNEFEFHQVIHSVTNFCIIDMSNFYLDILKDRLYVEGTDSKTRRAAQTTIWTVLDTLVRILSPILAFTCEEIWKYLPHKSTDDAEAVVLNEIPKGIAIEQDDELIDKWDRIHALREDCQKALEIARTSKVIGASLEAKVILHCSDELFDFAESEKTELVSAFIVSQLDIVKEGEGSFKGAVEGLSIDVEKASGEKCERCWMYSDTVGTNSEHPTLCSRCAHVLSE